MIRSKYFTVLLLAALVFAGRQPGAALAAESASLPAPITLSANAGTGTEFTGTITRVGNGFIVVAGKTVFVGKNTEVTGQLAVGSVVTVRVFRDGRGNLSAREVAVVNGAAGGGNTAANTPANGNPTPSVNRHPETEVHSSGDHQGEVEVHSSNDTNNDHGDNSGSGGGGNSDSGTQDSHSSGSGDQSGNSGQDNHNDSNSGSDDHGGDH